MDRYVVMKFSLPFVISNIVTWSPEWWSSLMSGQEYPSIFELLIQASVLQRQVMMSAQAAPMPMREGEVESGEEMSNVWIGQGDEYYRRIGQEQVKWLKWPKHFWATSKIVVHKFTVGKAVVNYNRDRERNDWESQSKDSSETESWFYDLRKPVCLKYRWRESRDKAKKVSFQEWLFNVQTGNLSMRRRQGASKAEGDQIIQQKMAKTR